MPKLASLPFQLKLALAFALVLLIPTLIFAAFSLTNTQETLLENAETEHLGLLRLKAASVETLLENAQSQLLFLTHTPTIESFTNALARGDTANRIEDSNFLIAFMDNALVSYRTARIYDTAGNEILRVDNTAGTPRRVPDNILEHEVTDAHYLAALELADGQVHNSGLTLSLVNGRINQPRVPVVYYSMPLYASGPEPVGVMVLEVFAAQALFTVRQIGPDADHIEEYTIIDSDGSYILSSDVPKLYGNLLGTGYSYQQDHPNDAEIILGQDEGTIIDSEDNPDEFFYFAEIQPTGQSIEWKLIISESRDETFEELTGTRRAILGLSGVGLLLTFGLALLMTRLVLWPLRTLSAAAEDISRGKWDTEFPVVRSRDEIGKLTSSFRNMTTTLEERTLELEVATVKAMEASRIKGEFLSTMSHELRTPLNAIIGFTELVLREISGPLTEKQSHQLSRVHANSLHLLGLINDILDLSKIEAGRMEIYHAPYSPGGMIKTVTDKMSTLPEEKGLNFVIDVDDALPESVIGDQARVEQVVINLLSNAFKFTEQGEVELQVKVLPDNERWQMTVRDTGVGIAPHALEYIFDEFRQADGTARRAYGGSGLGLAISRNLCRLMEGEIQVKSELGVGSTFIVTLPLSPSKPSVKVERPAETMLN